MENAYFQSEFFGSGILWMLLTFPAYWLFQWFVEGEKFQLWQRPSASVSGSTIAPLGDSPTAPS